MQSRQVQKDDEKEAVAIKDRYLGQAKKKKKVRKQNERKFVFDWDAGDDTSNDYNPLYRDRHQIQMYGRGYIAGMDIKSQRKESGKFYDKLLGKWSVVKYCLKLNSVIKLLIYTMGKFSIIFTRSKFQIKNALKTNLTAPRSSSSCARRSSTRRHSTSGTGPRNRSRRCANAIGVFCARISPFQPRAATFPSHCVTGRSR